MNMTDLVNAFPEWNEINPGQPVRQGDILSSVDTGSDPWESLIVVLTADCDLARAKHGGALSCVPLLSHVDYLLTFRFEKLCESLRDKLVGQMFETLTRSVGSPVTPPRISRARMLEWVVESDTSDVVRALRLDGTSELRFVELAKATLRLAHDRPKSIVVATRLLAEVKLILGEAKTIEKAASSIGSDFASTLKTLPGDALFLNELSPEHSQGYVAYLRRILDVRESSVVRTHSRIPHDARYLRISRLRSPYVYALSQQFASVFSAIGLPTEYENARERTLAGLKGLEI